MLEWLPAPAVRWLMEQRALELDGHILPATAGAPTVDNPGLEAEHHSVSAAVRWFTEQHALELDGQPSVQSIANLVMQVQGLQMLRILSTACLCRASS